MDLIKKIGVTVDLSKVRKNEDGSITVGDPNAPLCLNGDFLLELLTKTAKGGERDGNL